jgi:signal transduction histidine kinase
MVVDRKGSLWVGTGGQGLWRARNAGGSAPSLERATSLSGLLGDGVYSLLEDRDGNIWAGTTEGLNRLTPRTIEQIIDIGPARGVAMEPDGSVWIRTVDKLFSYLPIATGLRREIPIPADAGAMAIDDHGLWVAEAHRLFRLDRLGTASRVPWPLERQAGAIQSIQLDRQGGLWLVTAEHGIVHWRGGDLRRPTLPDAVRDAHVTAALVDTSGRAWFAFDNGGVARIGADEHAVLPIAPGPRAPVYTALHEADDGGLWLGGNGALSRFDNGGLATVQATDRFPIQSIMSLVSDRSGALWIGSPTGVLQVERDEFDRAVATPGVQPRHSTSLIIAERARLGREIHDTLLQGLVAIALQFDSLAHDLGPTPRLQARFLRLRDRIEEYIREARRSIWDLHTQPAHRNLVESLRRAGEFATDGREIAFSLQVQGTPYPCPPQVEEQVVRIAQEAALNSVRHASPRRLRIDLHYEESAVTLKVADDGRGFDSGEAKGACHFGIASMYDRARSVGGALTLVTSPGRGTEITAVFPVAS